MAVLGYVFPTTLKPEDAGFGKVEGILALAVTSHPDFDDTPLWDENNNSNYADDGIIFHSHWVVLGTIASLVAYRSNSSTKPTKLLCFHPPIPVCQCMDSPGSLFC